MSFKEGWELFISTPAGYIILGLIAFALYLSYVSIKNYFTERHEDRLQRAKEIDLDAEDGKSNRDVLQGMLTALTTTVANQTEVVTAIKEHSDAVRTLSESD